MTDKGDGAQLIDQRGILNPEARATVPKYRSDHITEKSCPKVRLSTVPLVSSMDSVNIYSKLPKGDTVRKERSSGKEDRGVVQSISVWQQISGVSNH